jgi:SepF-like predicted cell division protein (DUF552 family)
VTSWNPFPWGKTKKSDEESVDVENYVDSLKVSEDGFIEEEGVIYVKPIDLDSETAIEDVKKEIKHGNIVIADLSRLAKDQAELYQRINAVKKYCHANGGEIARVSQVKIMILPEGMEIAYPSSSGPGEE